SPVWCGHSADCTGVSPGDCRFCGCAGAAPEAGMNLLEVRQLSKRFGGNTAVDQVSFVLNPGELLALIGPNGAGKSTTFNMVGGQLPASGGSVLLDGQELLGRSSRRIAHLGVGRTFQIAATFASLTVLENVQMALLSHH